jgi:pyruvate,water dikinase
MGGKAATLARLGQLGFDVPPWIVIPPQAFGKIRLKPEALTALSAGLQWLGPGPFAVRSSARAEDGAEHSHAGQLLSLLDVPTEHVADAAHKVWRSGFSDGLAAYRNARGLPADDLGPAVLVQRMARARVAGVAFSVDPVSGERDTVVVNAVRGLADRLVGGEETGATYRLAKATARVLERVEDDGCVLADAEAAAVARVVAEIERRLAGPQDVEWAFEGDRLYVLQSRPVTTLHGETVQKPAATPAAPPRPPALDEPLLVWDNSNIVESYPGIVSPLTFSFARYVYAHAYRSLATLLGVRPAALDANRQAFETLLGRIDGRVYYNLLSWYRTLALLPGFSLNRRHMETMMGVSEALPAYVADRLAPPPPRGLAKLAAILRLARIGARLLVEAIQLPRTIRAFQARLTAALAPDPAKLAGMPLSALAAEYRALEASLLERWDAPLLNDLICMIAYGASRRLMQRWAGEAGLALHNDVLIGQGDIISAEPAKRVREMGRLAASSAVLLAELEKGDGTGIPRHPELARAFTDYIDTFGDRCTEELKLESLPLSEEPTPLLKAIAAAARLPAASKSRPGSDLISGLGELFPRNPLCRAVARAALSLAKARVRDRENLRYERTRLFGRVRRILLAAGGKLAASGRLDSQRDVFLLSIDEVLGAIEGWGVTEDLAALARTRRAEMARFAALPEPPERIEQRGSGTAFRPAARAAMAAGPERKGIGASKGIVSGRAKVIRDPRRDVLAQGEILVARFTDPGWIALFANASGIVVERGSLLSHSAIVARELGLPCVVALKGALDWIGTGEEIEIDGGSGIVRKRHG